MAGRWYEDAVFYALDVKTFQDSNGDGVGDFPGLTSRLDYLADLGVSCLWLQPFHPSPLRDDGYDVTDFYAVDPRLGTLDDFAEFVGRASELGLRLVGDLVVNHTSDQSPWFQSARQGKGAPFYDFYVWSETEPRDRHEGVVFPGEQQAIWSFDERAVAWYHHRFYEYMPDLNFANPAVREEVRKIMAFWMERGLSGFRLDAAPFLLEHQAEAGGHGLVKFPQLEQSRVDAPYAYFEQFNEFLASRWPDAVLIGEANVYPDQLRDFFGRGNRMDMLFNFLLCESVALALARQMAAPLAEGLERFPVAPAQCQWLNFLRHHDELSLEKLQPAERETVFAAFAPEERMRAYGRGIRRRLAPMLGGDPRRLELAYSLLFSLPGTPMIRYGDEIGMGEDLSLPQRLPVRTPMQWAAAPNAGFSNAPPEKLIRPVISGGDFGYQRVNVEMQRADPDALLNWMKRLIAVERGCPEVARGEYRGLHTDRPSVFAHRCDWQERSLVAIHNLAGEPCSATVNLGGTAGAPERVFGSARAEEAPGGWRIEMGPYGHGWFRVGAKEGP